MLSRIEIKEELERFIEWPTDDHGSVSATSTALFAHHVQQKATEKLRAELERVTAEHEQYKRDAMKEREAIKLLVAGGFVSEEKANDALNIAHGFMPREALSAQLDHSADKLEMVKPEPVFRDELGYWTHSAWPATPDDDSWPISWFAKNGLEVSLVELAQDATPEIVKECCEDGQPEAAAKWEPTKPKGEGWFVLSIHDTDDGPVCVWVRNKQAEVKP